MMNIEKPAEWDSVMVKFAEGDRSTYKLWREARPSQDKVKQLLKEFLHNCRFENCKPEEGYIRSMGTHPRPLPQGRGVGILFAGSLRQNCSRGFGIIFQSTWRNAPEQLE